LSLLDVLKQGCPEIKSESAAGSGPSSGHPPS